MTFDQAQSPRLGQPVPVESTYVRSFDVDPATPDADILEAAWPGMLIHRSDTHILMIYRNGAWEEIAGGIAGAKSIVSPSPPPQGPPGPHWEIGDSWYDQDDGMKPYVWDGTQWVATKGAGGILTFRQPTPPTSINVGDIWIDSNDGDRQYRANKVSISVIAVETPPPGSDIWSDGWVPSHAGIDNAQATADRKTRAYYADGWAPDDGDITTPRVLVPLTAAPDGSALTQGDIWYQTDNNNWCRFYTAVPAAGVGGWVDVADPNVYTALGTINTNANAISTMQGQINELQGLSYSANNTADTADGRISTSDYRPGIDDLQYIQYRTVFDPLTGEASRVPYNADRVDGSIWFVQTRKRKNFCTNPSIEVNLNDWSAEHAGIVRDNPPKVPAGDWTIKVTNDGTNNDHIVAWGDPSPVSPYAAAVPAVATTGQTWSASVFAELVTPATGGVGVTVQLVWLDVNGNEIGISSSDPMQLVQNVFTADPPTGMVDWRMWAHDTAPEGTTAVYARVVSPKGVNDSDVWHVGALLLESEPDLGKYFDGDSYDGFWDGVDNNSTSRLTDKIEDGGHIFEVWELRRGNWFQKQFSDAALAPINAANIYGSFDGGLISNNTLTPVEMFAQPVQALENLAYGDIVHVYNNFGIFMARKADASVTKNYEAHGFVWETVTAGQPVRVYHQGYVQWPTADPTTYVPGAYWLSTTPGKVQRTPPRAGGSLVQQVGFAASTKVLNFEPHLAIKIN